MGQILNKFSWWPKSPPPTLIQVSKAEMQTDNTIKTTKYNLITFLPFATILQFRRVANLYFLLTAILQYIPIISPLSPVTAILPLMFVLGISLIREAIEEYGKYKFDRKANSAQFDVWRCYGSNQNHPKDLGQKKQQTQQRNINQISHDITGQEERLIEPNLKPLRVRSDEIKVGDICKIGQGERLPADIVVLASSNSDGKCFIETGSLDGQKNLKTKLVLKITQQQYQLLQVMNNHIAGHPIVELPEPNEQLYVFNAQIKFSITGVPNIQHLKLNQFLYRQSILRNTEFIYGVVVYVGAFTKAMLNHGKHVNKMSQIQRKVNIYMVIIFALQLTIVILCGILKIVLFYGTVQNTNFEKSILRSARPVYSYPAETAITMGSYFILLNTMIPISLLVTIELVKFGQGLFINNDKFMTKGDTSPKAFRSSINEELGTVQWIFTDKTGTLTKNQMALQKLVIFSQVYDNQAIDQPEAIKQQIVKEKQTTPQRKFYNKQLSSSLHKSLEFLKTLQNYEFDNKGRSQQIENSLTLLLMATCHQCIFNKFDNSYQGSSPDQIALVSSAAANGYEFIQNSLQSLKLRLKGNSPDTFQQLTIIHIFQFDSDRKRMSVILSHPHLKDNKLMFTKGADCVIEKRLAKGLGLVQNSPLDKIRTQINYFSLKGLRTLMFGYKLIPSKQFQAFQNQFNTCRQQSQKLKLMDNLETNINLLGGSGVEDKLQDDVSDVIRDFIRASNTYPYILDIKVCMLTGDKLETAENIAFSCGLFNQRQTIFRITSDQETDKKVLQCHAQIQTQPDLDYAVLIQGSALPKVINSVCFSEIISKANAVVCCRITPKNKAQMVQFVRKKLKKLTLSVGDGANDVPMIMAANVGIGIYGKEGMNAVQASDFAIAEFKCLWRLLFVHGRWNYLRIAELIKYFFYKNILFTLNQLWYGYFCGYSGMTIYQALYLTFYNTIFTGGPVLVRALLEQDINYIEIIEEVQKQSSNEQKVKQMQYSITSKDQSFLDSSSSRYERATHKIHNKKPLHIQQPSLSDKLSVNAYLQYLFPILYSHTQKQLAFTPLTFFLIVMESAITSLLMFFMVFYGINEPEYSMFSVELYSVVLVLASVRIAYDLTYWTWLLVASFLFTTIFPYIGFMYVLSLLDLDFAGTFQQVWSSSDFYLNVFLAVGCGMAVQACFSTIGKYYFPIVTDFVRKQAKMMQSQKYQLHENLNRHKSITFAHHTNKLLVPYQSNQSQESDNVADANGTVNKNKRYREGVVSTSYRRKNRNVEMAELQDSFQKSPSSSSSNSHR